jgi:hypothetical protein
VIQKISVKLSLLLQYLGLQTVKVDLAGYLFTHLLVILFTAFGIWVHAAIFWAGIGLMTIVGLGIAWARK